MKLIKLIKAAGVTTQHLGPKTPLLVTVGMEEADGGGSYSVTHTLMGGRGETRFELSDVAVFHTRSAAEESFTGLLQAARSL